MLLNFVRHQRFDETTGLSGKIHTHLTTAPHTWFRGSFYGIYTNGDDRWKGYQIRAWSCYASWSLFCRRFVDIQQSFSCILVNSAELRWTKSKVRRLVAINYSLFYTDANQHRTSTPELHKVWWFQDNLSGPNSLNRNVCMIASRQWGDSRMWEQITFSNRHSWN